MALWQLGHKIKISLWLEFQTSVSSKEFMKMYHFCNIFSVYLLLLKTKQDLCPFRFLTKNGVISRKEVQKFL